MVEIRTFICDECSYNRILNRAKKRFIENYEKTSFKKRECVVCKKEISSSHNLKKYCDDCHKELLKNKRKDYDSKYRTKNKEKVRINGKKYLKTEKGKINSFKYVHKRRAINKNIIESFSIKEWRNKVNSTNGICPNCKIYVGINNLTLDHTYPTKKAFEDYKITGIKRVYTILDVQPLCLSCNSRKKDKLIEVAQ